jgi:hypothetical protein
MQSKFMAFKRTRKAGEYKINVDGQTRRVATVVKRDGRWKLKRPMTSVEYAHDVSMFLASINGDIPLEVA